MNKEIINKMADLWSQVTEKNLDPVNKDAVKKKFDDRKDKDIDNDGDTDSTDKYLHKRRKAISKAVTNEDKVLRMRLFTESVRKQRLRQAKHVMIENAKERRKRKGGA